ncbi:SMF protein [Teredinibacter turnerae T7901]|uniref:SMF protein n=1 Tax=Teredinibacter turnerae (strain ATCC 39867 / T7901) TaxID=377629 RepID=C5BUJ0_TERTT|nr:DNA-processing protein DprA [Teredinibacter turnerae]ACR12110.1 SMF protein [Teredinibacter turnerae T7901]
MSRSLNFDSSEFTRKPVSPLKEMAAYESLWMEKGATFKTIADKFRSSPGVLPSELVSQKELSEIEEELLERVVSSQFGRFGVRLNGANEYPEKLRDALNPVELFYYQGWWDLINTRCIAVVGARKVSEDGVKRTRKLVKHLVADGFTVVSGLAEGVDTVAHETAIENGGRTIAVIGTPLSEVYPKFNKSLQEEIRKNHLIISQVPFKRYSAQDYRSNRYFFPERNVTMSALSEATIIVEASDTSGTLYQARAALNQNRKLFILESCFKNPSLKWPEKYLNKGAIRVAEYKDIIEQLK